MAVEERQLTRVEGFRLVEPLTVMVEGCEPGAEDPGTRFVAYSDIGVKPYPGFGATVAEAVQDFGTSLGKLYGMFECLVPRLAIDGLELRDMQRYMKRV
jgi:hypothetical protein